uniref:Uncharacterized protein n=1 Tax=Lactuca sativa TaxID=4236 RepID=A0A9R1WX85_LACSA|nr:hypothetical protein LSAT_V11C800443030 [Lactuca sativa]
MISGLRSDAVSSGLRSDAASSGHRSDAGDKVPVSFGLRSDAVSGLRSDVVGKAQYMLICYCMVLPQVRGRARDDGIAHTTASVFILGSGCDQWKSILHTDGHYTIVALRRPIDQQSAPSQSLPPTSWHKDAPVKKIPSMRALRPHGVEVDTTNCGACIDGGECTDHILVTCSFTSVCGMKDEELQSVADLINFAANWVGVYERKIDS